ncbi:AfsA-related hotdog domain-containing protein [Streptomyces sp. 12297]
MTATIAPIQTVFLVGDRFAGFSAQDDVSTVTQFLADLQTGTYAEAGDPVLVQAAQGVTAFEWDLVREQIRRHGLAGRLRAHLPATVLAGRGEVHKCLESNALIADLHQVDDAFFRASLRVHNDNELLLDHQTGQHIQGMVAIEAARQMFLAVSERYFASRHPERNYYFVIESMNTDFENFLFPLDATIEYRIEDQRIDDPSRLSFTVEIGVVQAGRRASVTRVAFTAFDSHVIKAKEGKRARHAVEHLAQRADAGAGVAAPAGQDLVGV